MTRIRRESLLPLEIYAKQRNQIRDEVIARKRARTVQLGDALTLFFEDEMTMRYQIQEMLRVERIFDEDGIQAEIDVYSPLVPDGTNWKATMMLEYDDPVVRREQLGLLLGIEDRLWVAVEGFPRVYPIADEDLGRDTSDKTSAVHFVRFELDPAMIRALKGGARLSMGVNHPNYTYAISEVASPIRESLVGDLA